LFNLGRKRKANKAEITAAAQKVSNGTKSRAERKKSKSNRKTRNKTRIWAALNFILFP